MIWTDITKVQMRIGKKTLIAACRTFTMSPSRACFIYSNIAYATLGAALSRAANQSYYVPSHIFAPLGMKHTALQLTPALQAHLSSEYELAGNEVDAATHCRGYLRRKEFFPASP